jgi:hypothetical protein
MSTMEDSMEAPQKTQKRIIHSQVFTQKNWKWGLEQNHVYQYSEKHHS